MGKDVVARTFSRNDRREHRLKVRRCLDALAVLLSRDTFDRSEPQIGLEIELNLIDYARQPAMNNSEVLSAIDDDLFVPELGRFNIEINVPPRRFTDQALSFWEKQVRTKLNIAQARARQLDTELAMIGMVPTLRPEHVTSAALSDNPRYSLLDQQIVSARGEDIEISIDGVEQLTMTTDTIMPEAACTSTQVHVQASPDEFGGYWNAAQAIAGVQVALGANSPFLFGRQVCAESRIPLFTQATDTRPEEFKAQGVRPRVWFGERWITSIFDLFEENVRYFPALLPINDDQDPLEVVAVGGVPKLSELSLHNGTIYRWNRPVYDTAGGLPHVRIENRVLPSGPTVLDTLANAAFYAGLVRALATADAPVWSRMSYAAARDNFSAGVNDGIEARLYWPGVGMAPVNELVLRKLLPLAQGGLEDLRVATPEIDRFLGVIEHRCLNGINGATWQTANVRAREIAGESRGQALIGMFGDYLECMHSNEPVHTWPAS